MVHLCLANDLAIVLVTLQSCSLLFMRFGFQFLPDLDQLCLR